MNMPAVLNCRYDPGAVVLTCCNTVCPFVKVTGMKVIGDMVLVLSGGCAVVVVVVGSVAS